jgi:hypothetical protein
MEAPDIDNTNGTWLMTRPKTVCRVADRTQSRRCSTTRWTMTATIRPHTVTLSFTRRQAVAQHRSKRRNIMHSYGLSCKRRSRVSPIDPFERRRNTSSSGRQPVRGSQQLARQPSGPAAAAAGDAGVTAGGKRSASAYCRQPDHAGSQPCSAAKPWTVVGPRPPSHTVLHDEHSFIALTLFTTMLRVQLGTGQADAAGLRRREAEPQRVAGAGRRAAHRPGVAAAQQPAGRRRLPPRRGARGEPSDSFGVSRFQNS